MSLSVRPLKWQIMTFRVINFIPFENRRIQTDKRNRNVYEFSFIQKEKKPKKIIQRYKIV